MMTTTRKVEKKVPGFGSAELISFFAWREVCQETQSFSFHNLPSALNLITLSSQAMQYLEYIHELPHALF